jgi:flagellar biosynthesis/type III secretory pathway M-ring protein FliF/YscJ
MDEKTGKPQQPVPPSQKPVQPAKPVSSVSAAGQTAANTEEDAMKKLLAQLVNDDPASVAEIIHMWLNEDKNRNG